MLLVQQKKMGFHHSFLQYTIGHHLQQRDVENTKFQKLYFLLKISSYCQSGEVKNRAEYEHPKSADYAARPLAA